MTEHENEPENFVSQDLRVRDGNELVVLPGNNLTVLVRGGYVDSEVLDLIGAVYPLSDEGIPPDIAADESVSQYFREAGSVPLLNKSQEISLAQAFEQGRVANYLLSGAVDLSEDKELQELLGAYGEQLEDLTSEELETLAQTGDFSRKYLMRANTRLVVSIAKKYYNSGLPFLDLIQEGNMGLFRAVEKFRWKKGYKFSTYATWWVRQSVTRAIADQGRIIRTPVHFHEEIRKMWKFVDRFRNELSDRAPTDEKIAEEFDVSIEKVRAWKRNSAPIISLEKPVGHDRETKDATLFGDFVPDDADTAEAASLRAMVGEIENLLAPLPSRTQGIMRMRFGLNPEGIVYTLQQAGDKYGITRERVRQIERDTLENFRDDQRAWDALRYYLDLS